MAGGADVGDDSGVAHGRLLTQFVEAVIEGSGDGLVAARAALRSELGDAALVDAAATVASFNAIVKIADATGIPIEAWKAERTADLRAMFGIDAMREGKVDDGERQ